MKKHILKLRPLLLLMVLFVLANCQEDYNGTGSANQADEKYQILTGEKALKIKALLMQNLKDEGGLGMAKLSNIIMPNSAARGYTDVEPYLMTDVILGIKDDSGVTNYTLGVNMPDTSPVKFYNLLISSVNNTEKVVLVTYNLDSQFSVQYSQTGDMANFTGAINFELISLDTGFPCGNIPSFPIPVTGGIGGGGSGGGGGGGSGGGGSGGSPNPGNPYSQALIDAKFLQLKMVKYQFQSITVGPLENNGTIPDDGDGTYIPIGTLSVIEVPAFTGSADPCAPKQQIGIIGPNSPDKFNCDDLANKSTNSDIQSNLSTLKSKAGTQNFESGRAIYNNVSNGLTCSPEANGTPADPEVPLNMAQSPTQSPSNCVGFMHCHLDNGTFKVFSVADLIALATVAKLSTRPTSELVLYVTTGAGTFALKVTDRIALKNNWTRLTFAQTNYETAFKDYVKVSMSAEQQTLGLINFLGNEFNDEGTSGMSLYQQDANGNWEKLTANSAGTKITRKKC